MFTNIAVATDGSETAMQAIRMASDIAVKYGAKITVFHVLMHNDPPESFKHMAIVEHIIDEEPRHSATLNDVRAQVVSESIDAQESRLNRKLILSLGERIVEQSKQACLENGVSHVEGLVLEGDYADVMLTAAKTMEIDLIVLGARGLGALESLVMGSVSQKIVRDAECTCMVVK